MNAVTQIQPSDLPSIGSALGGGFYAGLVNIDGASHALVVSPKTTGETKSEYGEYGQKIEGAGHYADGLANTEAMAKAGSKLGLWARALSIGGYTDWAVPARDQLEVLYRNLKPTQRENLCSFRDGENPSAVPPTYPYTEQSPVQTAVEAFKEGGAEAFDDAWHWASTQYDGYGAWYQTFNGGDQDWSSKGSKGRARAVRVIPVG
jgi:hypothetical protein